MAKVVKFDAKDTLGKDFVVIDTLNNVKTVNEDMRELFNKVDAYEKKQAKAEKPVTVMDYQDIVSTCVISGVAHLLSLTKTEEKKLYDMSYSTIFDFYSEVANKFLAMKLPDPTMVQNVLSGANDTDKEPEESKDPKSSDEN